MDGELHEGITDSHLARLLTTIKYIPFFEAMGNNEYSHLNITSDEYFAVLYELQYRTNEKQNHVEKQLQSLRVDMTFLNSVAYCLASKIKGAKFIKLLEDRGINTDVSDDELIESIMSKVRSIKVRYDLIDGQRPKIKAAQNITGYDVIANLSASLEYRIPTDICIAEYIGHFKTSKMKRESQKKSIKNGR